MLRYFAWRKNKTTPSQETVNSIEENNQYKCNLCGWIYDENIGDPDGGIPAGTRWEDIPDTWKCPVCGANKKNFTQIIRITTPVALNEKPIPTITETGSYLKQYEKGEDSIEPEFKSIYEKAVTGKEEISAMGTKKNWKNLFDDILFLPAQLAHRVYDKHEVEVNLDTII